MRILCIFILLGLIISPCNRVWAQGIESLPNMVDTKDKKEIEKAIQQLSEAGELTKEANDYYNEALALQSNYELDEKTLQKELASTEKKAVSIQIKADKLYAQAYGSVYEVCNKMLTESSVSYRESGGMGSSAADLMEQAKTKRKEAESSKNPYEKAGLLNSAAELEGAAIDMMVVAVQIQSGQTPAEEATTYAVTTDDPVGTTDYSSEVTEYSQSAYQEDLVTDYSSGIDHDESDLTINQHALQKYNSYVNDPSIPDPVTLTRAGVTGVDDISMDDARLVVYGEPVTKSTAYEMTNDDILDEETLPDALETPSHSEEVAEVDYGSDDDITSETFQEQPGQEASVETAYEYTSQVTEQEIDPIQVEDTQASSTYSSQSVPVRTASGINFRVQIAASRVPLTRSQLAAIYSGKHTVEVQHVGEWYKYNISGFRLFSDANKVALECGVRAAWVTADQNGIPLSITEARNLIRNTENDVQRNGRKVIQNPYDYYVQVVAARYRLSNAQIPSACNGGKCREIHEEGWIKYQVYAGTSYQEALQTQAAITDKSFIVAYERGLKQKLYRTINK